MENLDLSELDKIFRQQVHRCQSLLEQNVQGDLIVKAHLSSRSAVSILQRYESGEEKKKEAKATLLKSALHNFSQSVLDLTYYQECSLASTEFTDPSSLDVIVGIIHTLSLPAQLCGTPGDLARLLGTELLECLYWRVGAMLYMYCYSICEKEERKKNRDTEMFLKCCSAGVCHLRLMLLARAPLREDEDYLANDMDMVRLLKLGIFSDIHMLSLMYAGDMCYWMWELSDPFHADTPTDLAGKTGTGGAMKLKKVCSNAPQANSHDGSHTTPLSPPDSSHLEVPPSTPTHVDQSMESSDASDRTTKTVDKGGVLSAGPTLSNDSDEVIAKKLEDVKLSSEIVPASSSAQERKLTSHESPPSQEIEPGCKIPKTISEAPVDLYHVMRHTCGEEGVSRWLLSFNPLTCGLEMLSKYIDAARGPLKGQGWEYSRAVKLMVQLKRATTTATHVK